MFLMDNLSFLVAGTSAMADDFYRQLSLNGMVVDYADRPDDRKGEYDVIFIFTEDDMQIKCTWIEGLKNNLSPRGFICINIDGIGLHEIQANVDTGVIGVNFCYPASASPFMEIVVSAHNREEHIEMLSEWAKQKLNKDPYVVQGGISARAYMLAAMAREAFYLVDQGFASIESVDRACRNDAGYYLPFTGNYLYMDLMGTVAYAMVMKDLNPELSNSIEVPEWFKERVESGRTGMKNLAGLYEYVEGDFEKWNAVVREFSEEINELIVKYRKEYVEE